MELKYIEWNLHAKGGRGYSIPAFIKEYIIRADIFVLTEFFQGKGWDDFSAEIGKKYNIYCSPFVSVGYNQICIGIKKNLKSELISIVSKDVFDCTIPEFLQVDVKISNIQLSIIGTRIKTQSNAKEEQYDFLNKHLHTIEKYICLGDFNCTKTYLDKKLVESGMVYGPRIYNGYYSYVHKNGGKSALDWIVTKGIAKVINIFEDKEQSPYATYDWSFVSEVNGYGRKTKSDYLNIFGVPDHAILKGMIEL